jgi:hypothetical protein
MIVKGGNFIERYVEKLVLAIVGILCVLFLLVRVTGSPNKIGDGKMRYSPSEIDQELGAQTAQLEKKMARAPDPGRAYMAQANAFLSLFEGRPAEMNDFKVLKDMNEAAVKWTIAKVNDDIHIMLPKQPSRNREPRGYRLPQIGPVTDVAANAFRAAGYVPTATVDIEHPYKDETSEVNDVDFVTVAAKFSLKALFGSFQQSFVSGVRVEWQDPCYAKPVFAAVQCQRQERLPDGTWSQWQDVPRTRIEARREKLTVIEQVDKLSLGGVAARKVLFDDRNVMLDVLQPETYRIASMEEQWMPPALHKKFVDLQRQEEARKKREAAETEKKNKDAERSARTRGGPYGESSAGRDTYGSMGSGETRGSYMGGRPQRGTGYPSDRTVSPMGGRPGRGDSYDRGGDRTGRLDGGPGRPKRGPRDRDEEERMTSAQTTSKPDPGKELYDQLDQVMITDKTDLGKANDLWFWAHDDTVDPGRTYRYQIRFGVFNPVAGTGDVAKEDKDLENNVILWSDYSSATSEVDIPQRLYFFANDLQEADKKVIIRVYKYLLGYWYGENFPVEPGEVIGKVIPYEPEKKKDKNPEGAAKEPAGVTYPETVDYSTGAVFVDVATVNRWASGGTRKLDSRHYPDMLYSFDGSFIERMPVGSPNWDEGMLAVYSEIDKETRRSHQPLRVFSDTRSRIQFKTTDTRTGKSPKDFEDNRKSREEEQWRKMMEE